VQSIDELAGLGKSQPLAAAVIAVCMFSLAGLPPLAGFWGKLSLFMSGLQITQSQFEQGGHNGVAMAFLVLLIVGALNAAIAAAYYLRLVSIMFFQPAVEPVPAGGGLGALVAATLCGALVVLTGIAPGSVMHFAGQYEEQMLQVADQKTPATATLVQAPADQ
jgi:NADH-quinone oxidoreductase subunit N